MDEEEAELFSALRGEGLSVAPAGVCTDSDQEVGAAVHRSGVFLGWLYLVWSGPVTPAAVLKDVVHVPAPLDELRRAKLRAALERP